MVAARRAHRTVPAYQAFVDTHGGLPGPARDAAAWLARLPVTDKRTYVDHFSLRARCVGGALPRRRVELDESAGSTGTAYTWARAQTELDDVRRTLALLARHVLDHHELRGRPVVTLNAFSMGAWATGTNVSAAMTRVGVVKSCGPDVDKILSTMALLGTEPVYLVCGYPPFLKMLVDEAEMRDGALDGHTLVGFVGGEGMTESLRDRLRRRLVEVYSAYGASDLDIGVAAETPFSVWIRRTAEADPTLALALFGRTERPPMVFQYDPSDYVVEVVDGELVVTVCRTGLLSPRIRYRVGDTGGVVDFPQACALARACGHDPAAAEADPFRLPLLFVHGRADSTLSFMGANLYPEDVERGLGDHPEADALGAFCLQLVGIGDDEHRPFVHVEHPAAGTPDEPGLAVSLAASVRDRLAATSADFRSALAESPAAADIRVRLWPPGTGPFAANVTRIKRRYLLPTAGSAR